LWAILFATPEVRAAEPIKVGAILPLADITGDQAAKAMKLAVSEINKRVGFWDARSN